MSKALLVLPLLLLVATSSHAQQYHVLGTDPSGDEMQGVDDIKTLSYAIDPAADSLWFRIECYNAMGGDLGYGIALNTKLTPQTGNSWLGPNKSMKYDIVIFIQRDIVDTNVVYGGVYSQLGGQLQDHFSPRILGPHLAEVNLKLSEIAPSGMFDVIAGAGFFDIADNGSTYDDIPNSGYFTVPTSGVATVDITDGLSVFPNPVGNSPTITIANDASAPRTFEVIDALGRTIWHSTAAIQKVGTKSIQLSTAHWPSGCYELISREKGAVVEITKLVK